MDEDFLHLFEESPALRLMRGRLGSFVVGFFFKTFKKWGSSEASEEELIATLTEHIEQVRELEDFDAPKRLPQDYLDEWCDEEHRYLTKSYSEERVTRVDENGFAGRRYHKGGRAPFDVHPVYIERTRGGYRYGEEQKKYKIGPT